MSIEIAKAIISRVKDYCLKHSIDTFEFVFHGGEPLLVGSQFYEFFVKEAVQNLLPSITPLFFLQTNATLINKDWVELFERLGISVGISIDGDKTTNDLNRIDHRGVSSYDDTIKGIREVQASEILKKKLGVLSVINIEANPVDIYEHFNELKLKHWDVLFPLGNYENLPNGIDTSRIERDTPYADWLILLFDTWYNDFSETKIQIRFFVQIIELLLGIDNGYEILGQRHVEILSIETDGTYEVDSAVRAWGIKDISDKNVLVDDFTEILQTDLSQLFTHSHDSLCQQCQSCPIVNICGGGYILNRYSKQNGFQNPSVYCHDLIKIIVHIHESLMDTISEYNLTSSHITYQSICDTIYSSESIGV